MKYNKTPMINFKLSFFVKNLNQIINKIKDIKNWHLFKLKINTILDMQDITKKSNNNSILWWAFIMMQSNLANLKNFEMKKLYNVFVV